MNDNMKRAVKLVKLALKKYSSDEVIQMLMHDDNAKEVVFLVLGVRMSYDFIKGIELNPDAFDDL